MHEGRDLIVSEKLDGVIGIGGGSSIDASKAMSMLSVHEGSIVDYEYGLKPITKRGPEIYIVPTAAGTGSEVTFWSVITDQKKHRKFDVGSPFMASAVSFVDPELTYSLPKHITAATGMDGLCHAIEAYTTKGASLLTDTLALKAIELISANLVDVYNNGTDKTARKKVMLGSTIAGLAFSNSGLGAVHGLTAPLGGHFNIPHGVANAILLPIVMDFNKEAVRERYENIAKAFGLSDTSAEALINHVQTMNNLMNIPALSEFNFNINPDMIKILAKDSLGRNSNCHSNLREVTLNDAVSMFKKDLEKK